MSRLPLSRGIHHEWMTSRLVPRTSTGRADGDDHLARGDDDAGDAAATVLDRVVDLPPPLLAGDVDDALGVARLVERHQGADRGDGDADEDQRRQDRQGDLERRLAVRLLGDRLAAVAVAPDDVADHGEHDESDDAGDDEHRVLQVLDLLGVRSGGLPRVLRGVVGAAGGGERRAGRASAIRARRVHGPTVVRVT